MGDTTDTDKEASRTTLIADSDAPAVLGGVDTEPLGDGEPEPPPKSPSPIIQIYRRLNSMFGDKVGFIFSMTRLPSSRRVIYRMDSCLPWSTLVASLTSETTHISRALHLRLK